jgi:hypothetical protein
MTARGLRSLRYSAVALALLAGAALFSETRDYGFVGHDTYPLIISSRVESFGDFAGLFSERLMDGRYPSPMYRPLTSATFAVDYAIWGLDPRGYHATNAALFAAIALALGALGAQLGRKSNERPTSPGAEWLVLALPVLFVLHPSFYEIAPVPARRADLLCCALMVAAVAASLGGRRMAAAAAAAAAIASKESGFAAPLLVVATTWLFAPRASSFWVSVVEALRESAPTIAVAALMLGLRLAVLGGLGGHQDELSLLGALAAVPRIALDLVLGVALVPMARNPVAWAALIAGLGLAVVRLSKLPRAEAVPELRIVSLAAIWVGVLSLTYASASWVGAWYYMIPAVGIEILLATLLCASVARTLDASLARTLRLVSAASALAIAFVVAWQGSYSPAFHRYSEWERATQVARDFETRLAARIEASAPGDVIDAPPLPMWAAPYQGVPGIEGAAVLSDYSVQAWAELVFPERQIRVSGIEGGVLPLEHGSSSTSASAPDHLRVRLSRRLVGY